MKGGKSSQELHESMCSSFPHFPDLPNATENLSGRQQQRAAHGASYKRKLLNTLQKRVTSLTSVFSSGKLESELMHKGKSPSRGGLQGHSQKTRQDAEFVASLNAKEAVGEAFTNSTAIGRFGVWHPEDSVVKEKQGSLFVLPAAEELESNYKLPKTRQRTRGDGVGGVLLFQETDPLPAGNESVLSQNCPLPGGGKLSGQAGARGKWNDVLVGHKSGAKRSLTHHMSTARKVAHVEGEFIERTELSCGSDLDFDKLKTGDDAVRFFAEQEQGDRVRFVYCNRVVSVREFLPYDLLVVPRDEVDNEYFVISPSGIIHIEPGSGGLIVAQGFLNLLTPLILLLG